MNGKEKAMQAIKAMVEAINETGAEMEIVEVDGLFLVADVHGNIYPPSPKMAGAVCNAFLTIFGGMTR